MCAIKSSHVPLYKTRTIESYPNRIQFRRNKKHIEGDILGKYPRPWELTLSIPPSIRGQRAKVYITLLLPAGKWQQQALMAADAYSTPPGRLFITDRVSNLRFLVDTGSDFCVFPRRLVPGRTDRTIYDLFAAKVHPSRPMDGTQSRSNSDFDGTSAGFRGGRRANPNHRGGLASQLQPLGRLPQQQEPGRCNFPVSTSPDGIHTVPQRKNHWEQYTEGQPIRRVPRPHTTLGSPVDGTPQHSTSHQNEIRPPSILSTPSSRTGPTRDSQSRVRRYAEGPCGSALGWILVLSATPGSQEGQRLAPLW